MEYPLYHIGDTLAAILAGHGIERAVVSPGSRNSTLIAAIAKSKKIRTKAVIDERCAAFVALGMSMTSRKPVCLICTSGTALLNYAPAVAEAYYRKIPLIVISADRPIEWIDQDDSQTIRQPNALSNIVKRSYDIPVVNEKSDQWYANRLINDAILNCTYDIPGPVHINIQVGADSLGNANTCVSSQQRIVSSFAPQACMTISESRQIGAQIASPRKIMVIVGFMAPDPILNKALNKLAGLDNFVVLTETISNLHGQNFVDSIDSVLSCLPKDYSSYVPDVVISAGGAIVSRHIKDFLRHSSGVEHWHISDSDKITDCFMSITKSIRMQPGVFFRQLASAMQIHKTSCNYSFIWEVLRNKARAHLQSFIAKTHWCDIKAFATMLPLIPRRWNIHYSNGTSIRYAQLFGDGKFHQCECNRGVSGIDGCTSTAIGASLEYNDVTLLITGDMSAQYDIGALAIRDIPTRFKMIVICNGGGGIFRFINSTSKLPILDEYLCADPHIPLRQLADGYGFKYLEASSENDLREIFPLFIKEMMHPVILAIHTDGTLSANILKNYFNYNNNEKVDNH